LATATPAIDIFVVVSLPTWPTTNTGQIRCLFMQPIRCEMIINLKTAKALGSTCRRRCSPAPTRWSNDLSRASFSRGKLGEGFTRRMTHGDGLERHSSSSILTHDPSVRVAAKRSAHLNGGRQPLRLDPATNRLYWDGKQAVLTDWPSLSRDIATSSRRRWKWRASNGPIPRDDPAHLWINGSTPRRPALQIWSPHH